MGRKRLLSEPTSQKLLSVLRRQLQSISRNVHIVRHIPEQTEDLYDILVDGMTAVHVELPRDLNGGEVTVEKMDIQTYLKTRKLSTKPNRRRLEIALELAHRVGRLAKRSLPYI